MQKKKSFKVVWAALLLLSAVLVPSGRALADATGSTVVGWGYNAYGQVGDGLNIPSDHYLPILVVGPGGPNGTGSLTGVKMIAPGAYHSLAVKTDGTVWSWGEGAYYNLGIGFSTVNYSVPQQVTDPSDATTFLQNVQAAAGGWWHNLALKNDGSVWGWGLDSVGQLGDGSTTNTGVPVQVLGPGGVGMLGGIKAISGGGAHTLALDSTGKVWAFGWNFYGQLGDGTNIDRHTPVQVTGLPVVKAIVAAYDFSLALDVNGSVWAWGNNNLGTLGNCSVTNSSIPVQVLTAGTNCIGALGGVYTFPAAVPGPALTGIAAIAASDSNGMALDSSGTVWAWGDNEEGGLGEGIFGYPYLPYMNGQNAPYGRSTANPVLGLPANIQAISTGYQAGHALAADGSIWSWGWDYQGQLGNNTVLLNAPIGVNIPYQVLNLGGTAPLTGVTAIASGRLHNFALIGGAGPASQSITFGALSNQPYGTAPFSVSATASSGLTVSFASTTTSICTVSGNTVTLGAVGQCTIHATQAGNANYSAATPVDQSFMVTQASQTISFGALSNQPLGTAPFTVSATASSTLAVSFTSTTTSVCTVSVATVTLVAVGQCTIQATQAGNANYAAATPINQSFQVTQSIAGLMSLVNLWETKPGVAANMVAALQAAQAAFASGNAKMGDNQLQSFINQVQAQTGKSLTAAQAALLIQYATSLKM